MFSKTLESTLNQAYVKAREKRHEFITVEHLLLALMDDPEVELALTACGANLERLRAGLGIFIDETTPHVPVNLDREIQPTLSFQRVLQAAIDQANESGSQDVTSTNVLLAIFKEPESQAVYFLNQENVRHMDVMNYISHGIGKDTHYSPRANFGESHSLEPVISPDVGSSDDLIELYTVNLNTKARTGKIDPLIGRHDEVMRTIQILCRRSKNNPLLVGEAGVGKTAIAEGLAQIIVEKKVPAPLANSIVYSLDLGLMLAGTKYRGDFEKRFKAVLKMLSQKPGSIVFIDEIHNLIGAGSATGGTMDASNLIKPLLSAGELHCMGATTYEEFRNYFAKDHALLRRFQKIDVIEPTHDQTLKILQGLQSRFENYHGIQYTAEALKRAVVLSDRYIVDRHLPDKAIDVIDEAGAYQRLQPENKRKKVIGVHEVEQVIAEMARIPIQSVTSSDRELLKELPDKLKQVVFDQDGAISQLCNAIKLSRAGLRDPNKPVGSFLMAGPTGVGKTEVTRQLAKALGVELIRFDMSEYMERHAVSRLIGAPPGYVGYDQGGLLTEAVIKHPYSVLLIDEIEKAHPDLFNILLQVMDYGRLTDNNGRHADFRHVIIVMTTNAGAQELEKNSMGFFEENDRHSESEGAIKQLFSPEFRNRLDAVVDFKHLDEKTILKVADKLLKELREQLKEKGFKLSVSNEAKQWLVKHGYNQQMGARPMARLIQERVKQPLAEELLFGENAKIHPREAKVGLVNGELVVTIRAVRPVEETVS